MTAEKARDIVLRALEDKKAEDIVTIPLTGKSSIADLMIIASGRSARQVAALAEHAVTALRKAGESDLRIEGLPQADWVLIDAGDLIVHVFRPEVRSFYNLEKLWGADLGSEAVQH